MDGLTPLAPEKVVLKPSPARRQNVCYAVRRDQDVETDDGGATSTTDGVPGVTVGLSSVSCLALLRGVAVGEGQTPFGDIITTGPVATHSA